MKLTQEQKEIANGTQGKALGLAMKTLIEYGEAFGASALVPIASAHVAGTFGIFGFRAYFKVLEQLAAEGVRVKVPTTLNPRPGHDLTLINRMAMCKQNHLESLLSTLGAIPNYSCVCYFDINIPSMGDAIAWAESSAIQYANSVLGARTNRNSLLIDICSAVTGYTPLFGYLLDENRRGEVLIQLKVQKMDASALGFIIGREVVDKVPVLEHYHFTPIELKNMGGAMAASGGVALFHVEGLTPEAPDMETVFDNKPRIVKTITQADIDSLRYKGTPDMILFGCPHMNFEEASSLVPYFSGRKIKKPVWFCVIPSVRDKLRESGDAQILETAGVEIHTSCPVAALSASQKIKPKTILTASGKCHYYLEGAMYGTQEDCLEACGVI